MWDLVKCSVIAEQESVCMYVCLFSGTLPRVDEGKSLVPWCEVRGVCPGWVEMGSSTPAGSRTAPLRLGTLGEGPMQLPSL